RGGPGFPRLGVLSVVVALAGVVALALSVFSGMAMVDFAARDRVLTGVMQRDPLFLMAVATMLDEQGVPSTGLHGAAPYPYHVLTLVLYSAIARVLELPLPEVFGHATFITFIPMLFAMLVAVGEELAPSRRGSELALSVILVACCFAGFLGRTTFSSFGIWNVYFISESYLLSLILLLALLSLLLGPLTTGWRGLLWQVAFVVALCGTKVSTGALGLGMALLHELLAARGTTVRGWLVALGRMAVMTMAGALVAAWSTPPGIPHRFEPLFFLNAFVPYEGEGALFAFLVVHYFFVIAAALALAALHLAGSDLLSRHARPALMLVAVTVVGFVPLNVASPAGEGLYFSNVSMFLAIPVMLALRHVAFRMPESPRARSALLLAWGLTTLGVGGLLLYGAPLLRRSVWQVEVDVASVPRELPITPYTRALSSLAQDRATAELPVYIAKEESAFWTAPADCSALPFLIPVLARRPALFGLPSPQCSRATFYGYPAYSPELFQAGAAPRLPEETLCGEATRLGFAGYVDVRATGTRAVRCPS
ncbi:MAG: hypothetical protein AB2A00_40690, partial [Myxococcota bacterium]